MASFAPSRLLLFGATGAIGKYITEAIIAAKPAFGHVAIFTSPATVTAKADLLSRWKASGVSVSVVVGDVTSTDDVSRAYQTEKPDTVVSALGRGALTLQTELVRLADAPGTSVRWFFPSEYGTDIEHNADKSPHEKPHQNKLALRAYIRAHVRRLKVTYLVTGPYFDMWVNARSDPRGGGFDAPHKHAYLIDDGKGPIGFCTMHDVGKFLVAALRHPEAAIASAGVDKALKVQSFVVTPREVLAEYEKQTGGAPWAVTSTPLQTLVDLETKAWADGNPVATGYTLRRIWAEGGTLYDKNDNELIGVGPGSADSLATAVAKALSR